MAEESIPTLSNPPQSLLSSAVADINDDRESHHSNDSGLSLKKRRATESCTLDVLTLENGPPTKKPRLRGIRGALEQVLNLPFDVQFEIFGLLKPADLLSLGRCSRELRNFVRDPAFKCIWTQSRRNNFPTLPACPNDMNEPAYAELIFGKGCLACGKPSLRPAQRYHIWEARTRLCPQCIQTLWINTEAKEFRRGFPKDLLSILPSCNLMDPSGAPYAGECYVSGSLHKSWLDEYNALDSSEQRDEWVQTKTQERLAIKEHSDLCQDFFVWHQEQQTLQKAIAATQAIRQRKARVLELVRSLGWGEDLDKMSVDFFLGRPDIARLCMSPLTDRVLEGITRQLDSIMRPIREARIYFEQQECYAKRMVLLNACYETALLQGYPLYRPRPRASDIFAIPRLQALVIDTPTSQELSECDFNITSETLESVIEEANNLINSKLLSVVSAALPAATLDPETTLKLATTVFLPITSGVPPERYVWSVQQVIEAPCSCQLSNWGHTHAQNMNNMSYRIFGSVPWNTYNGVRFHNKAHYILCRILELCGFDPTCTTLDHINAVDPIVECLSCNSHVNGRCLMSWSFTAQHMLQNHVGEYLPEDSAEFALVSDAADAGKARLMFSDMTEKEAFSTSESAVCMHCQHTFPMAEISEHVYTLHHIRHPKLATDINIVYAYPKISGILTPRLYRLWPPYPSKDIGRQLSVKTIRIVRSSLL